MLRTEFKKNRLDVGMVEPGECQSFLAELFSRCVVSDRAAGQDLQGDVE